MARKQKMTEKTDEQTEPTPFDGFSGGLPACVVAANAPVAGDDGGTTAARGAVAVAEPSAPADRAPVATGRREYTREDFAVASGAWISGFACKKCGCQDLRVHRTARRPDCSAVVRTRVCRNCGEMVNTVEQ